MRRFSPLFLCAALVLSAAAASEHATVEGKMTLDGKATKFDHVYATSVPTDGGPNVYRVILANAAISDADLALFPESSLGRIHDGKLTAIRLGFGKGGSDPFVEVYEASVGISSIEEGNKLAMTTSTDKLVAGRLHRDEPYTDLGGTYDYDVKFSAPIR